MNFMEAGDKPEGFREKLFDIPFQFFRTHLQRENNNRIIFSGKFGTGKTYFLEHFFKPSTQVEKFKSQKYHAVHLYPVNYSISATEDIFRYLKYDILNSFLLSNTKLESKDFEFSDFAPYYVEKYFPKIIATLITMAPKVGDILGELIGKYKELKQDFEEKAKKAVSDDSTVATEFLDEQESLPGSLYENDIITKLISNVLRRQKEDSGRENILIIDDLDRIDPEHLFRILNVFAAHLDNKASVANKLGFDKVIIVCDIHNLQSIFKTKFGVDSDFNGYIDKFYSFEVFKFDNRGLLKDIAMEAFRSIRFNSNGNKGEQYYRSVYFDEPTLSSFLLTKLIEHGLVNLRVLINRISCNPIVPGSAKFTLGDEFHASSDDHPLLFTFHILRQLAGGYRNLKESIKKIPNSAWRVPRIEYYCNQMLYYVNFRTSFVANDPYDIELGNKILTVPAHEPFRQSFKSLVVSEKVNGISTPDKQYRYSVDEFLLLLDGFIDIMNEVQLDGHL